MNIVFIFFLYFDDLLHIYHKLYIKALIANFVHYLPST